MRDTLGASNCSVLYSSVRLNFDFYLFSLFRFLCSRLKEREDVELFADATLRVREKNKKNKKKQKAKQRAIMAL